MTTSAPSEPAGRCTGTATPVEVSLCAHATTSTDGSDCGSGALPGSALTMIGSPTNGLAGHGRGELGAELAERQVQRALVDQPERGGIPERGRAAVAEDDLVAVGSGEQLLDAVAHAADQVLDRRLPVRGAEQVARSGQRLELFGADLDGPAAEATVLGLEVGGNRRVSHGDQPSEAAIGRAQSRQRLTR